MFRVNLPNLEAEGGTTFSNIKTSKGPRGCIYLDASLACTPLTSHQGRQAARAHIQKLLMLVNAAERQYG